MTRICSPGLWITSKAGERWRGVLNARPREGAAVLFERRARAGTVPGVDEQSFLTGRTVCRELGGDSGSS